MLKAGALLKPRVGFAGKRGGTAEQLDGYAVLAAARCTTTTLCKLLQTQLTRGFNFGGLALSLHICGSFFCSEVKTVETLRSGCTGGKGRQLGGFGQVSDLLRYRWSTRVPGV